MAPGRGFRPRAAAARLRQPRPLPDRSGQARTPRFGPPGAKNPPLPPLLSSSLLQEEVALVSNQQQQQWDGGGRRCRRCSPLLGAWVGLASNLAACTGLQVSTARARDVKVLKTRVDSRAHETHAQSTACSDPCTALQQGLPP